jgi:hypothetical protein
MHKKRRRPLAERFWEKVDKGGPDDCWEWTASRDRFGYGRISTRPDFIDKAHRVSYELHRGPIPEGMCVCHDCPDGDNPSCVNPAHLFLGTHQDNMDDMNAKQRGAFGERCGSAKLTEPRVLAIRAIEGATVTAIAAQFSVSQETVAKILRRETWKHLD